MVQRRMNRDELVNQVQYNLHVEINPYRLQTDIVPPTDAFGKYKYVLSNTEIQAKAVYGYNHNLNTIITNTSMIRKSQRRNLNMHMVFQTTMPYFYLYWPIPGQ